MSDTMYPIVIQAVAGENFTVYAYLLDGTIHEMDMKPLIQKGGVFERLKDTVAWDVSDPLA